MEEEIYHIEKHIKNNIPGLEYPFTNTWVFWYQRQSTKKKSYVYYPICKYNTIAGFWSLINNIKIKKGQRVIFMREGVIPLWEDIKHKKGAYFIITIEPEQDSYNIFLTCLLGIVGESFCNDKYDSLKITGLSFINEAHLKQIRFWLSDDTIPFKTEMISKSYINVFLKENINFEKQFFFQTFENLKDKTKKLEYNNHKLGYQINKKPYSNFKSTYEKIRKRRNDNISDINTNLIWKKKIINET